jgi:hypothetical protein
MEGKLAAMRERRHRRWVYEQFACLDCTDNTHDTNEYYMVHDHIWDGVVSGHGMLCIGCLEKRLGRRLNADDFTAAPVNHGFTRQSERLQSRLAVNLQAAA